MAVSTSNRGLAMSTELPARHPGTNMPNAVRDTATRSSRGRRPVDLVTLRRVRDSLARLPDSALGRYYFEVPGDCLACPRLEGQ